MHGLFCDVINIITVLEAANAIMGKIALV